MRLQQAPYDANAPQARNLARRIHPCGRHRQQGHDQLPLPPEPPASPPISKPAAHERPRTTKLCDRIGDEVMLTVILTHAPAARSGVILPPLPLSTVPQNAARCALMQASAVFLNAIAAAVSAALRALSAFRTLPTRYIPQLIPQIQETDRRTVRHNGPSESASQPGFLGCRRTWARRILVEGVGFEPT
jgi:hypothetical protein